MRLFWIFRCSHAYKYVRKAEKETKIFTKIFFVAYFRMTYASPSSLGKHFAWILKRFFAIMEKKQKICKKNTYAPKGVAMKQLPLGKYSRMILHIELPITLGYAILFLLSYLKQRTTAPVQAAKEYAPLVPYLLVPLMITAFSVLLIERLEREKR